jgi:curli production assembly/transport component CsgG
VVRSISTTKTIYSMAIGAGLRRYISVSDLLGIDAVSTTAEPTLFAVREAIELGVYLLVEECARSPSWCVAQPGSPSGMLVAQRTSH